MSHLISYLGVGSFPFLALLPFNIVALAWGLRHGSDPMPPDLALKSRKIDNYGSVLRDVILLLAVLGLAAHSGLRPSRIGLTSNAWRLNVLIGVVCGFLQVGLQRLIWMLLPPQERYSPRGRELVETSKAQWVTASLISVFAQELWIAFSVVTLKQTGHSTGRSLVLTGAFFAIAHLPYKLGAVATALYGIAFASLFLWRASLLPSFLAHYVGNMGAFYLARNVSSAKAQGDSPDFGLQK